MLSSVSECRGFHHFRGTHDFVIIDHQVHAVGGESEGYRTHFMYNPATNVWTDKGP